MADSLLLVVASGQAQREAVAEATRLLLTLDTEISGLVANRADGSYPGTVRKHHSQEIDRESLTSESLHGSKIRGPMALEK
jgi:Mrp family chromosome partitioning ATPase